MLQQFRQAIDVSIVRRNAHHQLARLYYIRAKAEEVAATYKAHHSDDKWKPSYNTDKQAGSQNVPQKDMELLNSLESDIILVCIKCTHTNCGTSYTERQIIQKQ